MVGSPQLWIALLPWLALLGTALAAMLAIALRRRPDAVVAVVSLGLGVSFATLPVAATAAPARCGNLLVIDRFALVVTGLLVLAALAVVALAAPYLRARTGRSEEAFVLLVLATLGAAVLTGATHVASLFLGIELLSVSLYGLVAYLRVRSGAVTAGVTYLIVAAASSAFLLFGAALLYAGGGSLDLALLASRMRLGESGGGWLDLGFALLLVGIGFKLAAVPFHMWAPDVYQGASAPVAAFIATVSKGGVIAVLLRFTLLLGNGASPPVQRFLLLVGVLAMASMLVGNLLALREPNLKRLLAYSSIAHVGYMLVAVHAGGADAVRAVVVYLAAYFAATLAAFAVVSELSDPDAADDRDAMEDYRGLLWRRPVVGSVLLLTMLSLAGIPLTAGFVAKVSVLAAGASVAQWLPLVVLAVGSVIGLAYYLRVVVTMLRPVIGDPEAEALPTLPRLSAAGWVVLAVASALTLWIGILPGGLLDLAAPAVSALLG